MEALLRFKMVKLHDNNGYSLLECLIVLLIVSVISISIPTVHTDSLSIFSKSMKMRCIQIQEQAFAKKEETYVQFSNHSVDFNGNIIQYPKDIVCDVGLFHYNADGNISKGGHITCKKKNESIRLVFQIGAGRVRLQH